MSTPVEHITWTTALRLTANVLTACVALGWMRFADSREGVLSSPSLHHRVYLRILVALSCAAFLATLLSLAATAHAATQKNANDERQTGHIRVTTRHGGVATLPAASIGDEAAASDPPRADR